MTSGNKNSQGTVYEAFTIKLQPAEPKLSVGGLLQEEKMNLKQAKIYK